MTRVEAIEFEERVIEPLRKAKETAHWFGVIRRVELAKLLEEQLEADLRLAWATKLRVARPER